MINLNQIILNKKLGNIKLSNSAIDKTSIDLVQKIVIAILAQIMDIPYDKNEITCGLWVKCQNSDRL